MGEKGPVVIVAGVAYKLDSQNGKENHCKQKEAEDHAHASNASAQCTCDYARRRHKPLRHQQHSRV